MGIPSEKAVPLQNNQGTPKSRAPTRKQLSGDITREEYKICNSEYVRMMWNTDLLMS